MGGLIIPCKYLSSIANSRYSSFFYSDVCGLKLRHIDYFLYRPIRKLLLRIGYLPVYSKEDITVVIAIRDRDYKNLENSIKSIRTQNYPRKLINIVLVDYDSKETFSKHYETLCKKYRVKYIRVNNKPIWNKPHALNIAIKNIQTKYLLSTDSDIIFEDNYIKEAINSLKKNPYQIILSICCMLPNAEIKKIDFAKFKKVAEKKQKTVSKGISLGYNYYYKKIHGYDEKYTIHGYEDSDFIKRLVKLGLNIKDISNKSAYYHQWHPKFEGVKNYKNYLKVIKRNERYLFCKHPITRNRKKWGEVDPSLEKIKKSV